MTTSPRWRVALVSAASAAMLVAAPLVGAQTAHAQPYPPPPPGVTLTATTMPTGDTLGFTGSGFASLQPVNAVLFSRGVFLGRFTADSRGVVTGTVSIPEDTRPGHHTFKLISHHPDLTLSAHIRVTDGDDGAGGPGHHEPQAGLADTGGTKALVLGGAALGLAAAGGATMLVMRRRRTSSDSS